MTLKEVAAVSGKPGLYKILKPTRSGVILESIDKSKKKFVAGSNSRVSILKEISIYTTGAESSVFIEDVYKIMFEKYGKDIPVSSKSDNDELLDFLKDILSNYDESRVYPSDVKKLVSWYNILIQEAPTLFEQEIVEEVASETETAPEKKKPAEKKASEAKKETAKKTTTTVEKKKATTAKKKPAAKKADSSKEK